MKLDLPIIGKIEIPRYLEFPIMFLAPIWAPVVAAFFLLLIILYLFRYLFRDLFRTVLLLLLPLICIALISGLAMAPWALIGYFFLDTLPTWYIAVSVIISGVLGLFGGIELSSSIMDTDLFKEIQPKDEDIDKGVWEDFMNR
ncbi:MAG: hypothetical protein E7095_10920 [Bacteroides sp.]|nr:hypothetical protein [Bacteroides sp.]